jgi:spermidine synthase
MLLPTIIMGTLFPLIGTIASSSEAKAANSIGRSYALNTIGCVLGSLVTGLLLIPTIGSYSAFQITVIIGAFAALLAILSAQAPRPKVIMYGVAPVLLSFPYSSFLTVIDGKIVRMQEDAIGSMMVLDFPKADTQVLLFNGSSLATTAMPSRRYMRLLGHLPALLAEHPETAMVACFGTGTTSGAIGLHPEVRNVRVVELSSMVLGAGNDFTRSNQSALSNPKLHFSVTDARNYLLLTDNSFDIITFEPPPPCDSGIVNLYTTDFYELVRKRLKPAGIMCQWIPQHEVSLPLWKMQVKSAQRAFPYVSVWLPNSGEALLVCSDKPLNYDVNEITRRMADPAVKESLSHVGINSAADLLATFVCDGQLLKDYVGDVPELTDDRPALEFFHPYLQHALADDELYALAAQSDKPFENDGGVKASRSALRLTFSQGDRKENLRKALQIEPENNWFRWLEKH